MDQSFVDVLPWKTDMDDACLVLRAEIGAVAAHSCSIRVASRSEPSYTSSMYADGAEPEFSNHSIQFRSDPVSTAVASSSLLAVSTVYTCCTTM